MPSEAALEEALGYHFRDARLLQRALTHRSFSAEHNERLEFVGDAVLGLSVAGLLFRALGHSAEGDLSRLRSQLVREESLHRLAETLPLPELLRVGSGEARAGGRHRASILADAMEAVLGAIYLDGGFDAADAVIRRLFADVPITPALAAHAKDAKTALQEWLQARKLSLPEYAVADVQGAEHRQTFVVTCDVPARRARTQGSGSSRRAAEQQAAAHMLERLQNPKP